MKPRENSEDIHQEKSPSFSVQFKNTTGSSVIGLFFGDADSKKGTVQNLDNKYENLDENAAIQDFTQKATISGMKYVGDKKSRIPRRCFWLLVVLTGAGFLTYQIIRSVNLYRSFPVNVDVKIKYAQDLPFPAITICNMNLLRKKEMEKHNEKNVAGVLKLLYPLVTEIIEDSDALHNFTLSSVNNLTELLLRYGHRKEDMIIWCEWKGRRCSYENFTSTLTDYGLCHTFNSGSNGLPSLRVDNTGARYALTLILNAEQWEYGRGPSQSAGFKIAIHSQYDIPMVSDLGFAVAPGTSAFIGLKMTKVSSFPEPYGTCKSRKLKYHGNYTMSKCQLECLIDFIVEKCGCKRPYMPVAVDAPYCSPEEEYLCCLPKLDEYASHRQMCDCPVPCERTLYSASLSYAQFPSDFMAVEYSKLLNKSDPQYPRRNGAKLNIFFEELSYEEISHRAAYELFTLFSDIGGSMGLLLGASFVTVVEIVDFACVNIYRRWRRKTSSKIYPKTSSNDR
ncbi:acid-sensing ion channel 1-like isoform X2 [Ptychodera flava]|uniref:acid-sensing ion channel 1-like isoform X2 n=1 Tax=Ptychodera flava TaxID=63121 RepID=UPI003969FC85